MKRLSAKRIILVFFIALSGSMFAQYITDAGKSWNVLHTYRTKRTRNYQYVADTIINDTLFRRLHYSYSEVFDRRNSFFAGFMHDDKQGNVFIKYLDGDTYKLYDFTVQTGDTVNMGRISATATLEFAVDSIDYIRVDSRMAKKIYLTPLDEAISNKQIWIEGIGSNFGPVEIGEIQYFNYNTALLCAHRNDTLLYKGEMWVCYYSNAPQQQKLLFNPASADTPSIEFLFNIDYGQQGMKIRVFDAAGKLIATKKLNKNKPFKFNKLDKGEYIIQLSDSFGRVYATRKIEI
jgi:hypothetical protein